MDTVVAYRKRYLEEIGKEETSKKFIKFVNEVIIYTFNFKIKIP